MGKPIEAKLHDNPIRGAMGEVSDAISSLNMHPDPIPVGSQMPDNPGYLSYTDRWAEHAVDHLRAAMECLRLAENATAFSSVKLLGELLQAGRLSDRDALAVLCGISEVRTPGEERKLHQDYLKAVHQMEVEGDG